MQLTDVQLAALVARVMDTHEMDAWGREPQPGADCAPWCPSCKVLRDIPMDILAAGARFLADAGLEQVA